jgi:hypothetical protein
LGRGETRNGFAERERRAAANFGALARREGIGRVVCLGGLGDLPTSEHPRSRAQTAMVLGREGPPLIYFRAGMVIGPNSESYRIRRLLWWSACPR